MIGGNYWAHPDGTGPSQTGADTNQDGFIDTPFDLFENAAIGLIYDYHPYSSNYSTNLIYAAGTNQHLTANQTSAQITVQIKDTFGNVTSGATVTLATNSTTGNFYSNPTATNQISTVTIPAEQCTASFYYKDTTPGSPVLTASSPNSTSATTQFSINASASVDHFAVSAPNTAKTGAAFTVKVTAIDAYGNNATSFTGTVALGATPRGVPTPDVSESFTEGFWSGHIILDAAGSIAVRADDGNGHFGISNAITVNEGTPAVTHTPTTTPSTSTPTPTPTPSPQTIPANTDNNTTINITLGKDSNITSTQFSNVTLTSNPDNSTTTLSFTVTGANGTSGFGNLTIAKADVPYGTTPLIYIDGQPAAQQGYAEDSQNYYVWFTTQFSTHNVEVQFTGQSPTPTATVPAETSTETYLITAAAAAIIIVIALALVAAKKHKNKKPTA
jgi:hypothetical protein